MYEAAETELFVQGKGVDSTETSKNTSFKYPQQKNPFLGTWGVLHSKKAQHY